MRLAALFLVKVAPVANVEGRATAITVLTPVKPRAAAAGDRVLGRPARHRHAAQAPDALVHPLRALGGDPALPGRGQRRAPAPHLPVVREQLQRDLGPVHRRLLRGRAGPDERHLGTSYGFPGPIPVEPFKQYIRDNEYVANHYWSAYPSATTTEIISARVAAALDDLRAARARPRPGAFKAAYDKMLDSVQRDL